MSNVTVGRYDHESITKDFTGWIEGTDDHGNQWIIYTDAAGRPVHYWPERDADGGVIGDGIPLG